MFARPDLIWTLRAQAGSEWIYKEDSEKNQRLSRLLVPLELGLDGFSFLVHRSRFTTAVTMKSLMLFAVILQVAITTTEGLEQYKFGDIIKFPRRTFGLGYAHYGVWVGDRDIEGKKPGENYFHITGPACNVPSFSDCVFGKLSPTEVHCKHNYLDDEPGYEVRPERIMQGIMAAFHKNCLDWRPYANNCEHLATYIRYGVRLSLQCGYGVGKQCTNDDPKAEELRSRLKNSAPC